MFLILVNINNNITGIPTPNMTYINDKFLKAYGNLPHTVKVKLWLPNGFTADKTEFDILAPHWTAFTADCISEIKEIKLKAGETVTATNEVLVELSVSGSYAREFIPLIFVAE